MTPIRITRHIDSDTLHLPELGAWVGKTVEITIAEKATGDGASEDAVDTSFFMALRPDDEPLTDDEIVRMKKDPQYRDLLPLLDSAGEDVIDVDAIARLRAASMI